MIKLQKLIDFLEDSFPPYLAEDWDPIGLHFGSRGHQVEKIMVALDVRPSVVQEAIRQGVDTLIVHHPPLFKPIQRFDLDQGFNRMYQAIIKHDLNIYAMHTNCDIATGGMNDWLAQALDLESIESLGGLTVEGEPKLGRIGLLPQPLSRSAVIQHIKSKLQLDQVTVIEQSAKESYQSIAIIGGSGMSLLDQVVASSADIFITGDITFHDGQDAYEEDLMTIDAGHYIEHIFIDQMVDKLEEFLKENANTVQVLASQSSTNPFTVE
ncbi:Nif3-like dinuclear metal center hexameric protein [Hutsoniella sourekii]|uniref:Nif3-like dinuclear metal center hexameric protein n=1 Tax=Hutsoniella sourekii TaxID=87650 RepID=UPI0004AD9788|nr:Nif3-like dinuclear metal center hexameric protein [Hutsoniella sourekii]